MYCGKKPLLSYSGFMYGSLSKRKCINLNGCMQVAVQGYGWARFESLRITSLRPGKSVGKLVRS